MTTIALAACGGGGGGSSESSAAPIEPTTPKITGYYISYPTRNALESIGSIEGTYRLKIYPEAVLKTGSNPIDITSVRTNANHTCAYAANIDSNNVSSFSMNLDGITPNATLPLVSAAKSPAGIGLDEGQSHRFVYAANFDDNSISRYSYDPITCKLTALGTSATLPTPSQVRVYGKYVLVATYGEKLQVYEINLTDGSLAAKGAALATGANPYYMVNFLLDETTTYIVMINQSGNSISTFALDTKQGVLACYGADVSVGAEPLDSYKAVLPNSQISLYVLNRTSESITALRFDAAKQVFVRVGPDTATRNKPFALTNNPLASIDDKYLYAYHDDLNTITAYEINQASGELKALGSAL